VYAKSRIKPRKGKTAPLKLITGPHSTYFEDCSQAVKKNPEDPLCPQPIAKTMVSAIRVDVFFERENDSS
jgi:hypothetical protein